ncbi:MAG: hypothetical protein WC254_05055 [Candidatus Woesearchaeota archaeon]|jgi:hypothetical protein
MEKWMIGILCVFLVLTACGAQDVKESIEDKTADAAKETGKTLLNEAMQNSVNLKCTVGTVFTLYYLDNEVMVSSTAGKTWIVDSYAYTVMKIGETEYLMKAPVSSAEVDYTTMKDMYYQSKVVQGYDCEEDVVSEADMVMPSLPTITNEEFNQKFQEEMMKAYQ